MKQMDHHLLFLWFADFEMDAPIWDATVFTKDHVKLHRRQVAAGHRLAGARVKVLL